jgi:hypothetical protein
MGGERSDWLGLVVLPGLCKHVRDPAPGLAETLLRTCEDARALVRRQPSAGGGVALTEAVLQEKLDNVRGAVM